MPEMRRNKACAQGIRDSLCEVPHNVGGLMTKSLLMV